MQLRYPKERGANRVTLMEAQINFESLGCSDLRCKDLVRKAKKEDLKDSTWHKIDLKKDVVEEKETEGMKVTIYPVDTTKLYYWSEDFWLKKKD